MTANVISLNIPAGIQKDGTLFDAPMYVDGRWVRFQRGRPRKMGGYRSIFYNAPSISRGMIMQSQTGLNYVYSGFFDSLNFWQTDDNNGVGSGPAAVSLSNFTSSTNNLWQFDIGYDSNGSATLQLIAHPGQNLTNIDSTVETPVLTGTFAGSSLSKVGVFTAVGNLSGTTITIASANFLIGVGQIVTGTGIPANTTVTAATVSGGTTTVTVSNSMTTGTSITVTFDNSVSVSGGTCMLYPYLFVYGNNGTIRNSSAGDFSNWVAADANENSVSATKIVKGMAVRGGTTSPAGLFWSLDSLIRVTYSPTTVGASTLYWKYDIVTSQSSILSSQSVIEYDGIYYWCGVDRFLAYNGVVQEIKNNANINYFFDNLNFTQRQKVWSAKIPRWGEIWWFYPHGDSTECNNAIIFNVRDQIWYDAGFASGANRSAGVFSEVFKFPIWADNQENQLNTYSLWQHEIGTDIVFLNTVSAVESYFETNSIGWVGGGPGQRTLQGANRWIRLERLEPDFVQTGDMSLVVTGKGYAEDVDDPSDPYDFSPSTLKLDLREQRREMRLKFISNTVNGNYQMGNVLISADIGDERSTGNP